MSFVFKKDQRILRSSDISSLMSLSKNSVNPKEIFKWSGRYFIFIAAKKDQKKTRLAIITSRKVGGAVVRNKIKRYLRETFRQLSLMAPLDVLVISKKAGATIDQEKSKKEFEIFLGKVLKWGNFADA